MVSISNAERKCLEDTKKQLQEDLLEILRLVRPDWWWLIIHIENTSPRSCKEQQCVVPAHTGSWRLPVPAKEDCMEQPQAAETERLDASKQIVQEVAHFEDGKPVLTVMHTSKALQEKMQGQDVTHDKHQRILAELAVENEQKKEECSLATNDVEALPLPTLFEMHGNPFECRSTQLVVPLPSKGKVTKDWESN